MELQAFAQTKNPAIQTWTAGLFAVLSFLFCGWQFAYRFHTVEGFIQRLGVFKKQ